MLDEPKAPGAPARSSAVLVMEVVPPGAPARSPAVLAMEVVPPGATAEQAFALMQQARIDALEEDVARLLRCATSTKAADVSGCDGAGAVATAAAAVAVADEAEAEAMPPQTRRPRWVDAVVSVVLIMSVLTLVPAAVILASGVNAVNSSHNALTAGTVVYVKPFDLTHCEVTVTYTARGGVYTAAGVLVDVGGCTDKVVGTGIELCYRWQDPGGGVSASTRDCSPYNVAWRNITLALTKHRDTSLSSRPQASCKF
jgi:hypothetical protein